MKYIEYAIDTFKNRGRITTLERFLKEQNFNAGTPIFRSYFRFDKDFYSHCLNNKPTGGAASPADFKGKHIADFVWVDVDSHEPDENIRFPKAFELLEKALDVISSHTDLSKVVIEFSSWGGFHISIPAGLVRFEPSEDLYARLSRFVKLLFPELIGAPGVDVGVYKINALFRLRNSRSDKGGLYKTKISLPDLEVLKKSPLSLNEYCNEPKPIAKRYLEPDAYWQFEPVPSFQGLWERTKELEKKPQVQGYSFTGFRPPGMPQCVSNIVTRIVQNQFSENSGRNNAFTILAAFYRNYIPTENGLLSLLRSLNQNLTSSLPDSDITAIVRQNFKAGGYGTGCMNPDSSLCTLSYCNGNSSLYDCPEYLKREKENPKNKIWMWGDEAFEAMKSDIAKGPTEIDFSFSEFARINKFIRYTDKIIVQGASTTGKSMFSLREMRHMIGIAHKRNEFVSLGIPEQGPIDYTKLMTMQQMGITLEGLYNSNGELHLAEEWYRKYNRSFVIQKAVHLTVASWRRAIEEAEQQAGKKCMLAFFDGVGFMDADSFANLAFQLADLATAKGMILWVVHHLTKTNTKDKKKDVRYEEGGIEGGHGTGWFGKAFDYVFSVFLDEEDRTIVAGKKFKQHWKKPVPLPKLRLYSDGYFGLYTAKEIMSLKILDRFSDTDKEFILDDLHDLGDGDYGRMVTNGIVADGI